MKSPNGGNRPPTVNNPPERPKRFQDLTPAGAAKSHKERFAADLETQLSAARRNAIRNRLGVLQNMPEWARNQHLNDPDFTRGMSEEDKALLRDLGHMHVGAPDRPND